MRLRRLLRLRGRARRRARPTLRRRAGPVLLLNASGCLDALTAPEVARSLDAFVTKTVTPEPRDGNPPVRIAEIEGGMLNAIGLANPGRERSWSETLPRLGELGVPIWVSVGGFSARDYAETCAQLDRGGVAAMRAQPLLPERRRGARVGGRDRRRVPGRDRPAALREALAGRVGHRRGRARRRGGGRRRALAREHDPRARARRGACGRGSPARRRVLGACAEADRARRRVRLPPRDRPADRRHGRRRARVGTCSS